MNHIEPAGLELARAGQLRAFTQRICMVGALVLGIGIGGCVTIPGKNHSKYHVIIGFGVIAISDPEQTALVATDMHSLGVMISDRPDIKLAVGYASSTIVTVAEGA